MQEKICHTTILSNTVTTYCNHSAKIALKILHNGKMLSDLLLYILNNALRKRTSNQIYWPRLITLTATWLDVTRPSLVLKNRM